MAPIDDSLAARVTPDCPEDVRTILYHAWGHDLSTLKTLLNERDRASVQDPTTGETPLHAAIRACGPAPAAAGAQAAQDDDQDQIGHGDGDGKEEAAREILQELFFSGAIWNDVDANNETPGCVAARLGRTSLYEMCVDAGVRAELLFAVMDGYEELMSGVDDETEGADDAAMEEDGDEAPELVSLEQQQQQQQQGEITDEDKGKDEEATDGKEEQEAQAPAFVPPNADEKPVTSEAYLTSALTYDDAKLLDADLNGVMMAWETDIMRRSVAALLPPRGDASGGGASSDGPRVLNIGFGMGIVDGLFAERAPSVHHIIEAHPAVLEHARQPGSRFGAEWERSGPADGAYRILPGRWQDVVPGLLAQGQLYDAIYFDTFGEDYAQLKLFFTEHIPGLLDQEGRFSFFNGLGADRRICYDVYTRVVEMHCADAGLDVEWEVSDVDMAALDSDGKGEWEGVRRRYWTLDKYRLPICTFMG
ncbi:Arginine N-methyltransferase 2 [Escovopsis weberi]|uniref:Protein arginine N-methyltransferase 2 n=1 Tax=Escovopsis weberi TaxID=150374 RepID=A0A0M9VRT0_ESCWE|nr:Arginine N-methyltransferase 2 [Escovopsis weberi]